MADGMPNPRKRATSMKAYFRWLKEAGYDSVDLEIDGRKVHVKATGQPDPETGRAPDPIDTAFGDDD